jgi:general secretion pathway protein I
MAGILASKAGRRVRMDRAAGFTLIEVLVALAIITISLTSVYRLQSDTFRMSADARFYTLAPLLAESKLAEIERQGFKNSTDDSGDFGQDYQGYSWTVRIEEVRSDLIKEDKYKLSMVDVTITRNEELNYKLRTYRFHAD